MSKRPDEQSRKSQWPEPSRGVKLSRIIKGHTKKVWGLAFDPLGETLASGSEDSTIKLWNVSDGELLHTLRGHQGAVWSVAFDTTGAILASGSGDSTIKLWDTANGRLLRTLEEHISDVLSVSFDPTRKRLASGDEDSTVKLWDTADGRLLHSFHLTDSIESVVFDPTGSELAIASYDGSVRLWNISVDSLLDTQQWHQGIAWSVAFDTTGAILASGGADGTVKLWNAADGRLLRTLEEHSSPVYSISFSGDGRFLASKSRDGLVLLWNCETWNVIARIQEYASDDSSALPVTFHPTLPLLPTEGFKIKSAQGKLDFPIDLWELDSDLLLSKASRAWRSAEAVHHTTAKIVLVGDSGVGKTGLGWRLAHEEFKEHSSTHGQQFWVVKELGKRRDDETECEAILWDLAGQPDYRLTHALFLDDADLALILFDPTDNRDPLHGVEFWLKQLKAGQPATQSEQEMEAVEKPKFCPAILVGGRADRGDARLTPEELDEFCRQRGISGGYLATSAKNGRGLDNLVQRMKELIPWEKKAATVTTVTFKRIKDYVLKLKENRQDDDPIIVSQEKLRAQLEATDSEWRFTDVQMMTAVGHLENYGYVKRLRTSKGEERVLLTPELLNNLAASFVLEARRNAEGLGSLEEQRLMEARYSFPELKQLSQDERDIMLDAAALLFLEHNICFRETSPLGGQSYLVFPELINMKKPSLEDEQPTEDGATYITSGAIGNVYASLVVLLGYTQTFTRRNQWQNQARYVMADGSVCGFRQESSPAGDLELVLYFGLNVMQAGRKVFEGLFESFLGRRNVTVFRYEPVVCSNGHTINRSVVNERLRGRKDFAFCEECGDKAMLPKADEPIQLTRTERKKVEEQHWFADQRTRFEQAIFQVMSYVKDQGIAAPDCFISYAWGEAEHERWVERNLAKDLQKAGIQIVLDRWENERVGASVSRFIERIDKCKWVIVVGTPLYKKKCENQDTGTGYVVAAEVDVISSRLLGTEEQKQTVLPVLLSGEMVSSFPPLLYTRVFADFRAERAYFITAFDLILDLYGIAHNHTAVADLRDSLRDLKTLLSIVRGL
jgi:GTPase SAR1 family protein